MDYDVKKQVQDAVQGREDDSLKKGTNPWMLDIRPTDRCLGLPYSSLISVELDLSRSPPLTLRFSSHTVTCAGQNLERVYSALVEQRARSLVQVSERYPSEDGVVITSIDIKEVDDGRKARVSKEA